MQYVRNYTDLRKKLHHTPQISTYLYKNDARNLQYVHGTERQALTG